MHTITVSKSDLPKAIDIIMYKHKLKSFKVVFIHPNLEKILRIAIRIPLLNKPLTEAIHKINSYILKDKVIIMF